MKQISLDKKTFYSYCLFTQRQRGYKSNWAFVMVKSQFGEWVDKIMKAETQAEQPTEEFFKWLEGYQADYAEQYSEEKEKQAELARLAKPAKPRKAPKPPKHDVERQMREVGEKLAKEGKNFNSISNKQLNRELQAWHIKEYQDKKLAKMTEEEKFINSFFN